MSGKKIVNQKRKPKGLTNEQISFIWKLRDNGLNQREIQNKLQTTRYYVRKTLRGNRPIPPKRLAPEPEYESDDDFLEEDLNNLRISTAIPKKEPDYNNDDNIDNEINWIDVELDIDIAEDEEFSESEEDIQYSPRTYILG